jgi:protein associated with RNAse G/E
MGEADRSPVVGDEVRVVYRKYDGSLHWNQVMQWLGEDEHGIWTGAVPPVVARRGYEEPVITDYAQVMLFPRGAWWTASFNAAPARTEVYCDISSPAQWPDPGEVTMIDLDLDVIRRRDGNVAIVDEDEFADHQLKFGYPPDVIAESQRAAAWLKAALSDGTEPFGSVYLSYLALLTGNPATT